MKQELNEAPPALLRLHATVMRAIQMFHELPDKVRKAVQSCLDLRIEFAAFSGYKGYSVSLSFTKVKYVKPTYYP